MSWIVASTLNSRDEIRERADINSDEFNDLMLIEKAIESLKKQNRISDDDLYILGIPDSYNKTEKLSRMERHTLSKRKAQICDRIAYYLGGYFTDDGYLDYIQKKYKFSPDQMNTLRKFIKSKNKHRIIRKPINAN